MDLFFVRQASTVEPEPSCDMNREGSYWGWMRERLVREREGAGIPDSVCFVFVGLRVAAQTSIIEQS